MIFCNHSQQSSRPWSSPRRWLAYGGQPRAIGHVPMNRLNKAKISMGHGCMPICIARKAPWTMQPTGVAGPVSRSAENSLMQNGAASQKTCFEAGSSSLFTRQLNEAMIELPEIHFFRELRALKIH